MALYKTHMAETAYAGCYEDGGNYGEEFEKLSNGQLTVNGICTAVTILVQQQGRQKRGTDPAHMHRRAVWGACVGIWTMDLQLIVGIIRTTV